MIISTSLLFAQQKTVLVEHFTNASCGPCASQNPGLQSTLDANSSKVTSIRYQWYFPGTDPMYDHNPTDVGIREDYYGINAVPNSILEGNQGGPDLPSSVITNNSIDNRYNTSPAYSLNATATMTSCNDIEVNLNLTSLANNNNNIVAHIVVTEELISFDSPPGSNGETEFHNVMKKMLPSASGTPVSAITNQETQSITESWSMSNVYDVNQIRVVCFIQNNSTKEVLNAIFVTPTMGSLSNFDATLNASEDIICGNSHSPIINLTNNGSTNLTSIDFSYSMNGSSSSNTYTWNGNLSTCESINITLPSITFTPSTNNTLSASITNSDDNISNNDLVTSIAKATEAAPPIKLTLNLDTWPEEISWAVKNESGSIIASVPTGSVGGSGPYSGLAQTTISENISITQTGCYTLHIYDAYGDGMHGAQWTGGSDGSYTVASSFPNTIFYSYDGSYDFEEEVIPFEVLSVGIENQSIDYFNVYPNPFNESATVVFSNPDKQPFSIQLIDITGKTVQSIKNITSNTLNISKNKLPAGIYYLQLSGENSFDIKKLTIY